MQGIAIITAIGGLLTIGFAYWVAGKIIIDPVKAVVKPVAAVGSAVAATSLQLQKASKNATKTTSDATTAALNVATEAHQSAAQAAAAIEPLVGTKELGEGVSSILSGLGTLPPPIAALCIALFMFLAAGGIEYAKFH